MTASRITLSRQSTSHSKDSFCFLDNYLILHFTIGATLTIFKFFLFSNLLEGTMPHQIWELPHLQTLNLKENSIFIGFMNSDKATKLEVLYLSDIDLGNIDNIGKLPALKEL